MTNSKELEKLIHDSGLKKIFIANQLNISIVSLLRKINNQNEFKQSEIKTLCKLLNLNAKQMGQIFFANDVENNSTNDIKEGE